MRASKGHCGWLGLALTLDSEFRAPRRRVAGAVRCAGPGQAGRPGAQLQLGHRPGFSVRFRWTRPTARRLSPIPSTSQGWEASSSACSPITRPWESSIASTCDCAPMVSKVHSRARWARRWVIMSPAAEPGSGRRSIKCRAVAGDLDLGKTFLRRDSAVRVSAFLGRRRDCRDQVAQAADRAAHAVGGHVGSRGQDRARRASATSSSWSSSCSCSTAVSIPKCGTRRR